LQMHIFFIIFTKLRKVEIIQTQLNAIAASL
jgi:hypothetical protein